MIGWHIKLIKFLLIDVIRLLIMRHEPDISFLFRRIKPGNTTLIERLQGLCINGIGTNLIQ